MIKAIPKIFCLIFLFITHHCKAQLIYETGDLSNEISSIISAMPGEDSNVYQAASLSDSNKWGTILHKLLSEDYTTAATLANELEYELIAFTDDSGETNELYYILRNNGIHYWGTYIYYPDYSRSIVLQAPHPKYDFNTGKEALYIFIQSKAMFFSMSGIHRCNSSIHSTCSGSTSACSEAIEDFRNSDMAHVNTSLFQQTTDTLFHKYADSYFLQLHGFYKKTSDPFIILSNGTQLTPNKDYISEFKTHLIHQDSLFGDSIKVAHLNTDWTRLVGFTNTQGRLINSSSDPCNNSANNTSGRFIHMEQEKTRLRQNESGWQKVSQAVKNTFPSTGAALVQTNELQNVNLSTALFQSEILSEGTAPIEERGFVYSTSDSQLFKNYSGTNFIISTDNSLVFSADINTLNPGTSYFFRAYATNSNGTAYGDIKSFTAPQLVYSSGNWTNSSGISTAPNTESGQVALRILDGNPVLIEDAIINHLDVDDGASLYINPNVSLQVNGNTNIHSSNGLVLGADANHTAALIDNGINYTNAGSICINQHFSGTEEINTEGYYHYVGSPIDQHQIFDDMADLYGYNENNLTWIHHSGFSSFDNGKGYAIRYTENTNKSYVGSVNTDSIFCTVNTTTYNGSPFDNYNLLSNPYAAPIDAESFVNENSVCLENNIYFWNGSDYSTYNTASNAGTAGGVGSIPNGTIALGQAFFVKCHTSGTVVFTKSMRTTNTESNFYRKKAKTQFRLIAKNQKKSTDLQLLIHPESSFKEDIFDSKLLLTENTFSMGTQINNNQYAIQSIPECSSAYIPIYLYNSEDSVVHFYLEHNEETTNQYDLFLNDIQEKKMIPLPENNYQLYLEKGTYKNRFQLYLQKKNASNFISIDNKGNVNRQVNTRAETHLFDINGQLIEKSNSGNFHLWTQLPRGVYVLIHTEEGGKVSYQKVMK